MRPEVVHLTRRDALVLHFPGGEDVEITRLIEKFSVLGVPVLILDDERALTILRGPERADDGVRLNDLFRGDNDALARP